MSALYLSPEVERQLQRSVRRQRWRDRVAGTRVGRWLQARRRAVVIARWEGLSIPPAHAAVPCRRRAVRPQWVTKKGNDF